MDLPLPRTETGRGVETSSEKEREVSAASKAFASLMIVVVLSSVAQLGGTRTRLGVSPLLFNSCAQLDHLLEDDQV